MKKSTNIAVKALISEDAEVEQTDESLYILCSMYSYVSEEYKDKICDIVSDNLDLMTPYTAYRAVLDGVLEFNDDIYNRFFSNTSDTKARFNESYNLYETPEYLVIKLYEYNLINSLPGKDQNGVYDLVTDPVHFDYAKFKAEWWPLLRFSDIGMNAIKYGKEQIKSAVEKLDLIERSEALHYIDLYSEDKTIDPEDVYYIPEYVENPKIGE